MGWSGPQLPVARLADPHSAPAGTGCPDIAAGWPPCCREHDHPQTRGVPRRAGLRGRDRAAGLQPADQFSWQAPKAATAVDPKVVASPGQAEACSKPSARIRPELTAFFGCLYYGALRPEEAIALRLDDCYLPARGWGMLTLTRACPAPPAPGPATAPQHEQRGLKHRPEGSTRTVPIPPRLVSISASTCRSTAPHQTAACSAVPAAARSAKAATAAPGTAVRTCPRAQAAPPPLPPPLRSAARGAVALAELRCRPRPRSPPAPGTACMLLAVYTHCIDGHDDIANRHIERALGARNSTRPDSKPFTRTAGTAPILSAICPCHGPHSTRWTGTTAKPGNPPDRGNPPEVPSLRLVPAAQSTPGRQRRRSEQAADQAEIWPTDGPQQTATVYGTAPLSESR